MHKNPNQPIGIFDSGIGGLTVANAIHRFLPEERLILTFCQSIPEDCVNLAL